MKFMKSIIFSRKHFHSINESVFNTIIVEKDSLYDDVVSFVGVALSSTSFPTDKHVEQHELKYYQLIVCPDGMTISLVIFSADLTHGQDVLDKSNIFYKLERDFNLERLGGKYYAVYDYSTYRQSDAIIRPLFKTPTTSPEDMINYSISKFHKCAEWEFGHVVLSLFPFLKFEHDSNIPLNCVDTFCVATALLKNIHICINEGNIASFFSNPFPPTLEAHLERFMGEINCYK